MSDSLFRDPITDDPWHAHFHAIGALTVAWNDHELILEYIISALLRLDTASFLITNMGNVRIWLNGLYAQPTGVLRSSSWLITLPRAMTRVEKTETSFPTVGSPSMLWPIKLGWLDYALGCT